MSSTVPVLNPYAMFLSGKDPLPILTQTPDRLREFARVFGPERVSLAPAPGKWSPRELICHLADCEIAFGFRLRQILAEENHRIQPFDQEKWAALYRDLPADAALAAFSALRHWNVLLIQSSLPLHAGRSVTHPERGSMTFSTIVETMAGHDLNHIAQLERLTGTQ